MAQNIVLTVDDYLYLEALAKSEVLDLSETNDFIAICADYIEHQDQQQFIKDLRMELPIADRDALEIAEAIRVNIINQTPADATVPQPAGQQIGDLSSARPAPIVSPLSPRSEQPQIRIPAQQQAQPRPVRPNPTSITPPPAPPQQPRELPKIPVGFTSFGQLNAQQSPNKQNPQAAPQISVYTQKTISAPSAAVFPSNKTGNGAPRTNTNQAEQKPAAPKAKSYEPGKDPYRETF